MPTKLSKDETYRRILEAAVRLDLLRGHLRWTIAELARQSGVKRTLIYYYFGKSRQDIIQQAAKILGEEFFGFNPDRLQMWKEGRIADAILESRRRYQNNPDTGIFYLLHRPRKTEIGQIFRALEKKYMNKLKQFASATSEPQQQTIWAMIFGFVVAPDVDEDVIRHNEYLIRRG